MKQLHFFALITIAVVACSKEQGPRQHYFLKGYEQLHFVDSNNVHVPVSAFMQWRQLNSTQTYQVLDKNLRLVHKKTGEGYTGPVRTFHWGSYNIEALFEDGYIYRMRYWHSNRQLGMDADYKTGTGTVYDPHGRLTISWTKDEMQYRNPVTQHLRQIISDTLTSYFGSDGRMSYYAYRTDTAWVSFYPDGKPRYFLPVARTGNFNGPVKRWYRNGQLRAEGTYTNGEESGMWTEYDSLGNILQEVNYDTLQDNN